MSSAHRLQTTPASIHDAIESEIPYRYRSEVITIFADLASDVPITRENAILRGHAVASQLKAIAESQSTPGLYTDAEPSACVKVATFLYAAMDDARQKAPSPYPARAVNDAADAYEAMKQTDQDAWRNSGGHQPLRTDSKPVQIGDAQTEYQRMLERDSQAWKGAR